MGFQPAVPHDPDGVASLHGSFRQPQRGVGSTAINLNVYEAARRQTGAALETQKEPCEAGAIVQLGRYAYHRGR